ncbi:phage tail tape measure protein, partial [Clostridium perfringens]|nr:phage tail tape measure protein [Clostridium perfringens]
MAGANIKIGASSSEFQKQMKEVTNQLKLVSSECGIATEKAKLFGDSQEKLTSIQKELTAKMQAQSQMINLYKDRIAGINSEMEKEKVKQTELSKKIEETTKKYKESVEATGK